MLPAVFNFEDLMLDTTSSVHRIEWLLCNHPSFNFRKHIIGFNIVGVSNVFPLCHECDMLVMSSAGYLTELEIKRSYADFVADFKKHRGQSSEFIKYFYYVIPASIYSRCYTYMASLDDIPVISGFITYEDGSDALTFCAAPMRGVGHWEKGAIKDAPIGRVSSSNVRPLFLEQRLEFCRLAALRAVSLRRKVLDLETQLAAINSSGLNSGNGE